ncbi:hypothetical protein EYZ11_000670 [Aspergillus tanneri]|uniref:Uncharacterized protein n=1 Tax=Aspergillus tanneri TaxID=1220188 RepID=A0A4S3JWJ3_9EURO|nr:uncharacterized protein ATNIH1004_004978 [Aspergillus tanneri]KAA8649083.1 hypothetical protein ATNIH1004_004978 [Aspergillus tanneri]THC99858.1 hypothetical protein EYZ11_000670 [Aspergillus tanneri]
MILTADPTVHHPTTIRSSAPISQSAAHDFLAAYLDRASTDPALQPSARISAHGPISRSTARTPGLVLHNLKRVQAGLAGEVLGRDLSLMTDGVVEGDVQPVVGENGDWEEAKKFEQSMNADDQEEGQMDVDPVEQEQDGDAPAGVDKEERKRKKKERRLAEKRAKAKTEA